MWAFYVSYFRCLWKCPVENSPTVSFPFSPSLKCPQSCHLLACAAAEPHLGPPAPEKPHCLLSAPALPGTDHQGVECTWVYWGHPTLRELWTPGHMQWEGSSRSTNIQNNSPHYDFVSLYNATVRFPTKRNPDWPSDFSCSNDVAAYTPKNTASDIWI